MSKKVILILFILLFMQVAYAQEDLCVTYFYSKFCGHCKEIKPFMDELENKYQGQIMFHRFDVTAPENMSIFNKFCIANEYSGRGVPTLGINNRILVGSKQIKDNLENEILAGFEMDEKICMIEDQNICPIHNNNKTRPADTDPVIPNLEEIEWFSILPLIFLTGLGDGINPCAFAVLIFVMAFLQQISHNKKRLIKITIGFITAVFVMNILLGVLYFYTSLQLGFPLIIRYIAITLAVIAGLINIKDFFFYGKGFSLKIPTKSRRHIEKLAQKATLPSAIILGGLVALLEAPCSIPIYLTVLEVLKGHGYNIIQVFPYVLIYNLMFILPLILLAGLIYYGAEADALESWRKKYRRWMKLSIGLILIALALAMLLGFL